jgi:hypothetical protein
VIQVRLKEQTATPVICAPRLTPEYILGQLPNSRDFKFYEASKIDGSTKDWLKDGRKRYIGSCTGERGEEGGTW